MIHQDPNVVPETGPSLNPRTRSLRRPLERTAIIIMAVGAAMMFQPFAKVLYSYSFLVILIGAIMFTIVSHLPE